MLIAGVCFYYQLSTIITVQPSTINGRFYKALGKKIKFTNNDHVLYGSYYNHPLPPSSIRKQSNKIQNNKSFFLFVFLALSKKKQEN